MDAAGKSRSSSSVRMTPPTWPVAPKTPTLTPLLISRLQFERFVQRLQRVLGPIGADDARQSDRRSRDHLDIYAVLGQHFEHGRRDTGMGLHAGADERHLGD